MKTITKLIPVIFLSVIMGGSLFYSCSQEKKEEIAVVLPLDAALSQAGENRVELEKALHRYQSNPSDSLKYRAACFLIENIKVSCWNNTSPSLLSCRKHGVKRYIHKQWWILSEGCMDRFL